MGGALALLFWLAVAAGLIYWAVYNGRSGSIGTVANRSPRDVVLAAVHNFTSRGWITTTQSEQSVTFSKSQTPSCLVTFFLLIFGIIPGLLYWIAAKRTLTVSVMARPANEQSGQSGVQIAWSRNGGGRGPSLEFKQLIAPGSPITVGPSISSGTLRDHAEDLTEGALSAVQLRREEEQNPALALAPGLAGYCPKCGAPRATDGNFCDKCGSALE
jgi:hypothetical protein